VYISIICFLSIRGGRHLYLATTVNREDFRNTTRSYFNVISVFQLNYSIPSRSLRWRFRRQRRIKKNWRTPALVVIHNCHRRICQLDTLPR